MLDIRFIRENAGLVSEKSKQKGCEVDVKHLLELDNQRRQLLSDIEMIRAERNKLAKESQSLPAGRQGQKPSEEQVARGKHLKNHLTDCEAKLKPIEDEYLKLLKAVPNIPADDVPIGTSEADNVEAKTWGEKPQFDFQPKTHWQIADAKGWIDKERAAKISGSRFAYIKGDLVKLQLALMNFVAETLMNSEMLKKIAQNAGLQNVSDKPFTPVLPPLMLRTEVFDAMDRLEPREERYKVGSDEDNLWLQGSAEHTLGPMYMNETLSVDELPIRLLGYATSFRREAGSYGKDIEGIIRMHQFDKLEMESFVNQEDGMVEHLFFIAIQEYLMQALKIPYRVLQKCTADIGKPNARGIDLEAWLPGAGVYKETHTADYMTDYQARRLQTRTKDAGGKITFVHTNDATAFAMGRTLVAIIENYQTKEGKINIPEVLQPYMHGQTSL